jgi:hypothetical protein
VPTDTGGLLAVSVRGLEGLVEQTAGSGRRQSGQAVSSPDREELAQVVAGAEQRPLGGGGLLAPEQEVAGALEDGIRLA